MKKYTLILIALLFSASPYAGITVAYAACDGSSPGVQIVVGPDGSTSYICPATSTSGPGVTTVGGQSTGNGQAPVTTTQSQTPASPTQTQGKNLGYTPLEPIPGLTTSSDPNYLTNRNNLPEIVNAIFKIFITVGALLAVLSLAVGGIQYMVSSSAELKNAGIDRAKAALWGIVLIAASWLILNTINPNLLKFNLNPCPAGAEGCTITGGVPATTPTGYVPTAAEVTQATQALTNGVNPSQPDTNAQTLTAAQTTLDQANTNDKANCKGTIISGAVTAGYSPMGQCNQTYSTCTVLTSNQTGSGVTPGIQYVCAQN